MKENTSNKNSEKPDDSKCAESYLSVQKTPACPSVAVASPADGQAVESARDKISNVHDNRSSMAVSVTRHASTPSFTQFQNQIANGYSRIVINTDKCIKIILQYRLRSRESSKPTNSLPNSLPRKDEQDQILLREVESGRESTQMPGNIFIDKIIRKVIDQSKNEVYNLYQGKSDLIEGLIKEINNESI